MSAYVSFPPAMGVSAGLLEEPDAPADGVKPRANGASCNHGVNGTTPSHCANGGQARMTSENNSRASSSTGRQLHPRLHHPASRGWLEPSILPKNLIFPVFVTGKDEDRDIPGFAPNKQWGAANGYATLVEYLQSLAAKGLTSVMLFGVVPNELKDAVGCLADDHHTPVVNVLKILRSKTNLCLMADVCLCEYTDHGHCGILRDTPGTVVPGSEEQIIDNEKTLLRLQSVAVEYAQAGTHWCCPSDMMDGRIGAIRDALNRNGFPHVAIMSYTSKKASAMYSPFRAAVDSTFKGDRMRYQHPIGSVNIANAAYARDLNEGADAMIVKPSLFYGDIIRNYADRGETTVVSYLVSGEYKMLYDYGVNCGCMDQIVREAHLSLFRSGTDVIITYFAPYILETGLQ